VLACAVKCASKTNITLKRTNEKIIITVQYRAVTIFGENALTRFVRDLDYIDLKSSDRKEDARMSQIDW
jgi:hypothetical protein